MSDKYIYDEHAERPDIYRPSEPEPSAASAGSLPLPEVVGRMIEGSIDNLERRAKLYIGKELEKLEPDNALIAILSDTVRLGREFSDTMNRR
jgi:hypothetical protein